jgi:Tol biopolymer transport system component
MHVRALVVALVVTTACGRTSLFKARKHLDAALPRPDVSSASVGPDAATPPDSTALVGCAALTPLAGGLLTPRHAKQVLFANDRSTVVLRVAGDSAGDSAGSEDDVLVVRLPGGDLTTLISGATDMEWLDGRSRILARHANQDLSVVTLDGRTVPIAANACDHVLSPDGQEVLSFESCDATSATLWALKLDTGLRTQLGKVARYSPYVNPATGFNPNASFSPGGRWIAYRQPSPAPDGSVPQGGIINLVGPQGAYALTSVPGASLPYFVSDTTLLVATPATGSPGAIDIHGHTLGTDTSYLVAKSVDIETYFGYRVSPDGRWLLAALVPVQGWDSPYALGAYDVQTGDTVALAADLFPFWSSEVAWYSFAFSADARHVLYLTAGRPMHVATVAVAGGAATVLSAEPSFTVPSTGSLVALSEQQTQPPRVRLADLDTGLDVASANAATTPIQATFTPSGRALVFTEAATASAPARLRHLAATGRVSQLGQWRTSQLGSAYGPCCNEPYGSYPIDPTGCFLLVDSDLDGGTRLVLLPADD